MKTPKYQVGQVVRVAIANAQAIVAGQLVTFKRGTTVEIIAVNVTARRVRYQVDQAQAWFDESMLEEVGS